MARTDYEAAWRELMAHVASKTSHGREETLVKMAELADEHKIPEDLLEKAARISGGVPAKRPEARSASIVDRPMDERMGEEPPGTDDQGGHDGREKRTAGGRADPVGAR